MAKSNPEKWEDIKAKAAAEGKDPYKMLKGHLSEEDRAHPGKPGWKIRHGQDAIGKVK